MHAGRHHARGARHLVSDFSAIDPRPGARLARRLLQLLLLAIGELAEAHGQLAQVLLRLLRLRPEARHLLDLPELVQVQLQP